jgi:hypothetical protein
MSKCLSDTGRSISPGAHVKWRSAGGKLKVIAMIEEPVVIETILKHIGLDPEPPPRALARRVDL